MSDQTELKPRGVVKPKGVAWLEEVKIDAAQAAIEHVTRQLEKKEFEAQKARGLTVEAMTAAAKKKLQGLESFEPLEDGEYEEDFDDEDVAPLAKPFSQLNKTELLDLAATEGVAVEDNATNDQLREAITAHRKANP